MVLTPELGDRKEPNCDSIGGTETCQDAPCRQRGKAPRDETNMPAKQCANTTGHGAADAPWRTPQSLRRQEYSPGFRGPRDSRRIFNWSANNPTHRLVGSAEAAIFCLASAAEPWSNTRPRCNDNLQ